MPKIEGFFSLPLDGGGLGWGVKLPGIASTYPPPPNPLPPGAGDVIGADILQGICGTRYYPFGDQTLQPDDDFNQSWLSYC